MKRFMEEGDGIVGVVCRIELKLLKNDEKFWGLDFLIVEKKFGDICGREVGFGDKILVCLVVWFWWWLCW